MTAWQLLALLSLATACGGRSTHGDGSGGGGGASGMPGGSAGRTGEDACAPLGNDATHPPARTGCYAFDEGAWLRIPCECEIPLENSGPEAIRVRLVLAAFPEDIVLSATEAPSIEVRFADLDGRYFDAFSTQPGSGVAYAVTRDATETRVTMLSRTVTLGAVSLWPCEARYTQARVRGPDTLSLEARVEVLSSDTVYTSWTGSCVPTRAVPPSPK